MSKAHKIKDLESLVYNLELELKKTKLVIAEIAGKSGKDAVDYSLKAAEVGKESSGEEGLVIEGVFNGQDMIGPDGKQYSVPANYASKSKLVEGDIMKLTIDKEGTFLYKQIAPAARARLIGRLVRDHKTNEFVILVEDAIYKVILASITYFKGQEGDEVVILVPKDGGTWGAVENIIKNTNKIDNDQDKLDISL